MFKQGAEYRQFLPRLKSPEMIKYYLTLSFFLILHDATFAQKENKQISKFELHPIVIDTINEDVFVVHKRYATLYFKQPDIQEYSRHQNKFGLPSENSFIIITSMLRAKKKRIDLDDWFNEYSDEEKMYFKFILPMKSITIHVINNAAAVEKLAGRINPQTIRMGTIIGTNADLKSFI